MRGGRGHVHSDHRCESSWIGVRICLCITLGSEEGNNKRFSSAPLIHSCVRTYDSSRRKHLSSIRVIAGPRTLIYPFHVRGTTLPKFWLCSRPAGTSLEIQRIVNTDSFLVINSAISSSQGSIWLVTHREGGAEPSPLYTY